MVMLSFSSSSQAAKMQAGITKKMQMPRSINKVFLYPPSSSSCASAKINNKFSPLKSFAPKFSPL
jgi:hypothetical protein